MTFSSQVKNELSLNWTGARHCQIAETAAILAMCGGIFISPGDKASLKIHTENKYVARKYSQLLHRTFHIAVETGVRLRKNVRIYSVGAAHHEDAVKVLKAVGMISSEDSLAELMDPSKGMAVQKNCCKRAYLRGAFLVSGSISDPKKFYHLEIVCAVRDMAERLLDLMKTFELDARIVERKGHSVVYLKDGSQIVDMLGVMEAGNALMDMENIRILREISNDINRRVNCEAANISKTVSAAVRQTADIRYIQETIGLYSLPPQLEDIAKLRLEYPEMGLADLGMQLEPPIGKSGVNHRLKKISEIAHDLREKNEK